MAHDRGAGVNAVEVPVGVVGEGDRSRLVGRRLPADVPHVVVVERECGAHLDVAGVAALAVGGFDFHYEADLVLVVYLFDHGPFAQGEAAESTMQRTRDAGRLVVQLKGVFLSAERELARADAVAVAAHKSTVVGAAVLGHVLVERRPAERHVVEPAGAVGDDRLHKPSAEIGELQLKAVSVYKMPKAHFLAFESTPGH